MGTNAINTDRPYTPSSSIAPAATAGYRCRWHRSSGSYSRQSGKTASDTRGTLEPQTRIGPAKLPWGCTVSNWRRDTSGLFRRESEAAAKTAEAMIVQVASGASCIRTRATYRINYIAAALNVRWGGSVRRSWLRERRWRGQRERPPVAAVAPPLPRRPLSKEERHEIMRDDILARMRPDKNHGETAARLCPLHTWKLATRSPHLADSSWAIR